MTSNTIAIDFEFIEDGRTIDPISVGLAHVDGRRYYAIFEEFEESKASPWVKENVISKLPPRFVYPTYSSPRLFEESLAWKSSETIRLDILRFVGDRPPEFWGNDCAHDFVLLGRVIGKREQPDWATRIFNWLSGAHHPKPFNPMIDCWPNNWPYFIHDVQAVRSVLQSSATLSRLGNPEILPPEPTNHVSIEDAEWVLNARQILLQF